MLSPIRIGRGKKASYIPFYIVIAVLCTCLNVYAFRVASKSRIEHYTDLAELRRPNAFVGLDRVVPPKHVQRITVYPAELSQINSAAPTRAYSDDPVLTAEIGGLTPVEDREFKVSSTVRPLLPVLRRIILLTITAKVSTVAQFRTVDYKMESCELVVSIPARPSNFSMGLEENLVEIWKSAADSHLDVAKLTWDTRPRRQAKVGSVLLTHGMNYTYQFPCPADHLFVFEFSGGPSTSASWVQNHAGTSGTLSCIFVFLFS